MKKEIHNSTAALNIMKHTQMNGFRKPIYLLIILNNQNKIGREIILNEKESSNMRVYTQLISLKEEICTKLSVY